MLILNYHEFLNFHVKNPSCLILITAGIYFFNDKIFIFSFQYQNDLVLLPSIQRRNTRFIWQTKPILNAVMSENAIDTDNTEIKYILYSASINT